MIKFCFILLVLFNFLSSSQSANILAIQATPYYSHQLMHYEILRKLAEHGHNLTIFSTYLMDFGAVNVTQFVFEKSVEINKIHTNILDLKVRKFKSYEYIHMFEFYSAYKGAQSNLDHPEIKELIFNSNNYNFDVLILEDVMSTFYILSEIYDCPIFYTFSSVPLKVTHNVIGNNLNSIIHPEVLFSSDSSTNLNFFERLWSLTGLNGLSYVAVATFIRLSHYLVQEKFPNLDFPPLHEIIAKRVAFLFDGSSSFTSIIHTAVPSYQKIGFIHTKIPNNITDLKVKEFLDKSTNGVVVVSFGTLATQFNQELLLKFLNVFKSLPFNIIWKTELDSNKFDIPKNILTSKWLQLADILAHPNVKVLVTHGGLRTIEEAIDRAIPMVIFPLCGDQPVNADFQANQKTAMKLDLNDFKKESLTHAILEMSKVKYKHNVAKIRSLAYDRMNSSLNEAVENIEYYLKHRDVHHFQDYAGWDTSFYDEIILHVLVIIGRILTLFSIISRLILPY
ncbi:hypothetical protein ACKWTF_015375 [Chironomus riparius]